MGAIPPETHPVVRYQKLPPIPPPNVCVDTFGAAEAIVATLMVAMVAGAIFAACYLFG